MSNSYSLDDLRAEIEQEYAPLKISVGEDEFVLKSLFRVDKKVRQAVIEKLTALEESFNDEENKDTLDEDAMTEAISFVVKSVTADRKGNKLATLIGTDLLLGMKVLEKWRKATQPGEATDSPS